MRQQALEIRGSIVSFRESGSGTPVLFVHSGPGTAADWRGVFERFSDGYRLVAINGFGQGGTSAWPAGEVRIDDYAALVSGAAEALGGRVHLVGHSYGGAVALRTAVQAPDLLRTLVVIEPQAYPLLRERDPVQFAEVEHVAATFATSIGDGRPDDAWRGFIDHYSGAGSWDALPDPVRRRMCAIGEDTVRAWAALFANPITADDLRGVETPTLVLQGAVTATPERRMCEIVADLVPGAERIVIDAAGHMLPLTHPEETVAALEAHLTAHAEVAPP